MYESPVICKCQHPVRIVDKVHGGYLYVPCGHCPTCVASSRSKWMQRLNQEAEQSAYVLFFTLTYSNDNLPIFFDNGDGYYSSNRSMDFDLNSYIDNAKVNYVNCPRPQNYRKFAGERIFATVCKKDVQDFFKRLRRKLEVDSRPLS